MNTTTSSETKRQGAVSCSSLLGSIKFVPAPSLVGLAVETEADRTWRKMKQREADLRGLKMDMLECEWMNRRLCGDY